MQKILNQLERLGIPHIDRYRFGQILFIVSFTFGLFLNDTVRKILFFGALFCLRKEDIKLCFSTYLTKPVKLYGILLAGFWVYMLIVPLLFGGDPFKERVISIGWPIEIMLWMFVSLFFAVDGFFIKTLGLFSIAATTLYNIIALNFLSTMKFSFNDYMYRWPLHLNSWIIGTLTSCLFAWLLYYIFGTTQKKSRFLMSVIFCSMASFIMVATAYTTFWLLLFAEFAVAVILAFIIRPKLRKNNILKIVFMLCLVAVAFIIALYVYPNFITLVNEQIKQLTALNSDITVFTTRRNLVWKEAVQLISQRPIFGYGWADYEQFTKIAIGHTHNSLLQIIWTAGIPAGIIFICLVFALCFVLFQGLFKNKYNTVLCFVICLIFISFILDGMLDNTFKATRRVAMLYWFYFALPLSKSFLPINSGNNE